MPDYLRASHSEKGLARSIFLWVLDTIVQALDYVKVSHSETGLARSIFHWLHDTAGLVPDYVKVTHCGAMVSNFSLKQFLQVFGYFNLEYK